MERLGWRQWSGRLAGIQIALLVIGLAAIAWFTVAAELNLSAY